MPQTPKTARYFPAFVASRLKSKRDSLFSSAAAKIAVGSVAIGLAVMIIADSVFNGFQEKIVDRVLCFSPHLHVTSYSSSDKQQDAPMSLNHALYTPSGMALHPAIQQINAYVRMAGLVKSREEMMGALFKGVDQRYDSTNLHSILTKGNLDFLYDDEINYKVAISQAMADKLLVNLGDPLIMYFIQVNKDTEEKKPPRPRRLKISAIYQTGMEEFDEQFIFGRMDVLQKLNNWSDTLVGGFEIYLDQLSSIRPVYDQLEQNISYEYMIEPIDSKYEHYFSWFEVLSQNVVVVIFFIGGVVCINVISVLVILIMERTQMIGTLKAIGAQDRDIQLIFFLIGVRLCIKGTLLGLVLGIGLGMIQEYYHIIPLDPHTYYMSTVPIVFNWWMVIFYTTLIILLFTFIQYFSALIVSKIQPIKSIRFA